MIEVVNRGRTCRSCGSEIAAGDRHMVVVIGRRKINVCNLCITVANEGVGKNGRS
jgi:ribosome-binding protein aMBF1 (putative translation factor)